MTNTEIKNELIEIQRYHPESILSDICEKALDSETELDTLAELLKSQHRDRGIKYSLDKHFFIAHLDEIESIIKDNLEYAKGHISLESHVLDASWFAYQVTVQDLLVKLDLLQKEDARF